MFVFVGSCILSLVPPPPIINRRKYRKTILTHILFLLFLTPLSISTQAFSCVCFHSMNLHFQLTNTFCLTSMTSQIEIVNIQSRTGKIQRQKQRTFYRYYNTKNTASFSCYSFSLYILSIACLIFFVQL